MHPCLTPVLTSKASEVPSAVRTQHLVSVYSSPTRFTSWLGTHTISVPLSRLHGPLSRRL